MQVIKDRDIKKQPNIEIKTIPIQLFREIHYFFPIGIISIQFFDPKYYIVKTGTKSFLILINVFNDISCMYNIESIYIHVSIYLGTSNKYIHTKICICEHLGVTYSHLL
jgi:non-homologous end joining protein Ku